jgi:hypothetical protein
MARRVSPRTPKGYDYEVTRLTRLRSAIVLDRKLDPAKVDAVCEQIDGLIRALRPLLLPAAAK